MRKTITLTALALCTFVLVQGCKKAESAKSPQSGPGSKKRVLVDEVGDNPLPTGTYKFVTHNTWANSTNYALHAVGGVGAAENALVEQRNFTTNNNGHEWRAVSLGSGNYNLYLQGSFKVLTVLGTATPASGMSVGVKTVVSGNTRQIWKIEFIGLGTYKIKLASNTALAVNITPAGSTANGAVFKLGGTADLNSSFLLYRMGYKDIDATNWFKTTTGWTAGDGGVSYKLSNGKVLWAFGDSHYNDYSNGTIACWFGPRNLARVQNTENNWDPNAPNNSTLINPALPNPPTNPWRWLFRSTPSVNNSFNWPGPWVEVSGYVYNLVANFEQASGGGWTQIGPPYLAKMNVSTLDPTTVTYHQVTNVGTIDWAGGFVKETDGYIYAFGFKGIAPYFLTSDCYVARFPQSNPTTSTWNFWNGSNWNSTVESQAAVIHTGYANHVAKVGGKYVRSGMQNTSFFGSCAGTQAERSIFGSWSNSPATGWSAEKTIYVVDDLYMSVAPVWYGGIPSAANLNSYNEMVVVYSINGYKGCIPDPCTNNRKDPNITYRPRAVRIPLKVLDPSFP